MRRIIPQSILSLFVKSTPQNYKAEGDYAYDNFDFHQAINYYQKAILEDPNDIELYAHLGASHLAIGDLDEAEENINKAIKLDANNAEFYYFLGNLLGSKEDHIGAIDNYKISARLSNDNDDKSMIYYNIGYTNSILENDKEAIENFTKSIQYNNEYVEAYYNRSVSYSILQQYQAALFDTETVLQYEPNHAGAYYVRASAFEAQGNIPEALKNYDLAVRHGYGEDAIKKIIHLKNK